MCCSSSTLPSLPALQSLRFGAVAAAKDAVENALAHTPQGTQILVSAERRNGSVRLAVRDSGLGIRRDVLPRIFEPFFTSDDAQGSGLGLAIARELAEQMDGRLAVESVPGRTTFTLELPA